MSHRDRVVLVGASGFGRECLDVLYALVAAGAPLDVIGVVDDYPSAPNLKRLAARGVAYMGTVNYFIASGDTSVEYVLGIGHPATRRSLVERFDAAGFVARSIVHPSAVLGSVPVLDEGVVICSGAVVSTNVRLGRHVHVNPHATIGHDAVLADYVSVNPAAVVSGEVEVGRGVLVGANATILQGLSVGERAVIGAGSVVTHSVPDGKTVKGVPGRWS